MNPMTSEQRAELYREMTKQFFFELCWNGPWNHPPDPSALPGFPWDRFTASNPRAKQMAAQFSELHNYELSEHQCSRAVRAMELIWVKP